MVRWSQEGEGPGEQKNRESEGYRNALLRGDQRKDN